MAVDLDWTGLKMKEALCEQWLVCGALADLRLVSAGKVIQDALPLRGLLKEEGQKVYATLAKPGTDAPAPDAAPSRLHDPKRENPLSPILKFLSEHPELYQQMLLSNPQMQELVQKNPELGHALNDPQTLKSMLKAAVDPAAQAELMRNHDRAMANLETIPEGFSHLKRIYSTMQEPLYELSMGSKRTSRPEELPPPTAPKTISSTPIPNPWAPKTKQPPPVPQFFPAPGASGTALPFPFPFPLQPASLPGPPAERFAPQLQLMHSMGFLNDDTENIPALLATNGHVQAAIDRILAQRRLPSDAQDPK